MPETRYYVNLSVLIGEIRDYARRHGKTISVVLREAGLSDSFLADTRKRFFATGTVKIRESTAKRLMKFLNVPEDRVILDDPYKIQPLDSVLGLREALAVTTRALKQVYTYADDMDTYEIREHIRAALILATGGVNATESITVPDEHAIARGVRRRKHD